VSLVPTTPHLLCVPHVSPLPAAPAVHPFADGNGRLGRVIVNYVLRRRGIPFLVTLCPSSSARRHYTAAIHASAGRDTTGYVDVAVGPVISPPTDPRTGATLAALARKDQTDGRLALLGKQKKSGTCRAAAGGASSHGEALAALPASAPAVTPASPLRASAQALSAAPLADYIAAAVAAVWEEIERAAAPPSGPHREPDSRCMVCLCGAPNIATLCCGAPLHLSCITKWLMRNESCVQCRAPLVWESDEGDDRGASGEETSESTSTAHVPPQNDDWPPVASDDTEEGADEDGTYGYYDEEMTGSGVRPKVAASRERRADDDAADSNSPDPTSRGQRDRLKKRGFRDGK